MFDEQHDGNPHGECAAEIHRLETALRIKTEEHDCCAGDLGAVLRAPTFERTDMELQELKALAAAVKDWGNYTDAWLDQSEDEPAAVVGHIDDDGNTYPVATVDCDQYYAAADSLKLAKFYAASPRSTPSKSAPPRSATSRSALPKSTSSRSTSSVRASAPRSAASARAAALAGLVGRAIVEDRGVESRQRQFIDPLPRSSGIDVRASCALAAENPQALAPGDDFSSSPAERIFGPRALLRDEVEPVSRNAHDVTPIARIVRLHHQPSARFQAAMHQSEEFRRDQPSVGPLHVPKRLGVVQVDLRDRVLRHVLFQEVERAAHRKPDMVKPALVRATGRVTDHHGQNIEPQKVPLRVP